MPILYTSKRPQFGKWHSTLRSSWTNLSSVNAAIPACKVAEDTGSGPQSETTSQCSGPKIQTARGGRADAVAVWEVYTHTFIETEEICYSIKHLVKVPSGCHSEHLALALLCGRRCSIIPFQLYTHPNPLRSLSLELLSGKKQERKQLESWASLPWAKVHRILALQQPLLPQFSVNCSTPKSTVCQLMQRINPFLHLLKLFSQSPWLQRTLN